MAEEEPSNRKRPTVAFAMRSDELRDELFPTATMTRLNGFADIAADHVLTEFLSPSSRRTLGEVDALITGWGAARIDSDVISYSPHLGLIAHAAGTVRSIVDPACWASGIAVTSAAQANAIPVAEFALAMILLAGKKAFLARDLLEARRHDYHADLLPASAGNHGITVGIIGASKVGRLVIDLLRPFDYTVLLCDPYVTEPEASRLGVELIDIQQLMATSDIVSLHAPLLPATRGMIGAGEIARLRDGSTVINTARGALIDQPALIARLRTETITAILDVTDPEHLPDTNELYTLPTVFLTPHIAGSLGNETSRLGTAAVDEIERLSTGQPFAYPVRLADLTTIG